MALPATDGIAASSPDATARSARRLSIPLRLQITAICLWLLMFTAATVARRWPESIGQPLAFYGVPSLNRAVRQAVEWVPFSITEVATAVLLLLAFAFSTRAAHQVLRGRRRAGNALGRGLLLLVSVMCVIDLWGVALMGYMPRYLRAHLDWPIAPEHTIPADELARWTEELVDAVNAEYAVLARQDDAADGTYTLTVEEVDAAVERASATMAQALGLPPAYAQSTGYAKPLLSSALFSYLGIGGICSFFTQEPLYNAHCHGTSLPYVIAHEKAHMYGLIVEDEASLLGYLACIHSDEPLLRYSGYWYALQQIAPLLCAENPVRCRRITARLNPGPRLHLDQMIAHYERYRNPFGSSYAVIWDAALRASVDERGLRAYDDISLLAAYARRNGGSLAHAAR